MVGGAHRNFSAIIYLLFIVQVNSKGYVSLGSDQTLDFDQSLSQVDSQVIAPFFADIDTGSTGAVYYR